MPAASVSTSLPPDLFRNRMIASRILYARLLHLSHPGSGWGLVGAGVLTDGQ